MAKYDEILVKLKQEDQAKAEYWEEEINLITHKLKFLPSDAKPTVCILDQNEDLIGIDTLQTTEKVQISGGILKADLHNDTEILIIRQRNENLYSLIPPLIQQYPTAKAVINNKVYIIQETQFDESDNSYLGDLEILAEIIQPKYFFFGREGTDWIKFDLI